MRKKAVPVISIADLPGIKSIKRIHYMHHSFSVLFAEPGSSAHDRVFPKPVAIDLFRQIDYFRCTDKNLRCPKFIFMNESGFKKQSVVQKIITPARHKPGRNSESPVIFDLRYHRIQTRHIGSLIKA